MRRDEGIDGSRAPCRNVGGQQRGECEHGARGRERRGIDRRNTEEKRTQGVPASDGDRDPDADGENASGDVAVTN